MADGYRKVDNGDGEMVDVCNRCDTVVVDTSIHNTAHFAERFSEYLSQPCDECPLTATHNGRSKFTGKQGQFCNGHVDWDAPAHARDD
jgi:hypothetical protein